MKKLIIVLMALGLISLVVAGGISLMRTDTTISLSNNNATTLKRTNNLQEIRVEVSEIECDNEDCFAEVYQKGLINTKFRHQKDYCSTNEIQLIEGLNKSVCLEWTDYSNEELIEFRDEFIEKRLSDYSNVQAEREAKQDSKIAKVGGGTLTNEK